MNRLAYTYIFNDLTEILEPVQVIDNSSKKQWIRVAVDDYKLLLKNRVPSEIADLIDLAVSVYVADRLSVRQSDISCHIHIILPVRHPETFARLSFYKCLQGILYWYTNDHWSFEFKRRTTVGRPVELQRCMLPANKTRQPAEIALWSGGLDSLAGLYNRLCIKPTIHYTLFGTGGSSFIHSVQQRTARAFRSRVVADTNLVQVPIRLASTKGIRKNHRPRSRGFVFLLLGAVCACLEREKDLYIYENGIGAINLPFRASEVGLDHSRSVHPLSLIYMGDLVSEFLNIKFRFHNPFLYSTKAEMCTALIENNATDLIFQTISCDRRHRQRKQPLQCGFCSSCLLRRQALTVLNIKDETKYIVTHGRPPQPSDRIHLLAMLRQIDTLYFLLNTTDPWHSMSREFPDLSDIVDWTAKQENNAPELLKKRLLNLYKQYVDEWQNVKDIIQQGLIDSEEENLINVSTIGAEEQLVWI